MTPKVPLKVIAPTSGPSLIAPPVLIASNHSVDYTCGGCGAVLLHADVNQVYNLVIRCSVCETFNTSET